MAAARYFMRSCPTQRGRARGFSLLEALTVLVIIGLLTSLAVVVYGGYRRALRAKTTAQQIQTLFTTARALAINQNSHFQAVLDLGTSGLWIDQIDRDGNVTKPKLTTPENWSIYVRAIEIQVNGTPVQDRFARVQFHPNGTSDSARILLLSEGGDSRTTSTRTTIKLYSSTARSRIFLGTRL